MNEYWTIMKDEHIIELECKFIRVMRRIWSASTLRSKQSY